MTRIEAEIYKKEADDLIGLRVITYDDDSRVVSNVVVVDPEDLEELQNDLISHTHDETYVTMDSMNQLINDLAINFFNNNIAYKAPTFEVDENGNLYVEYYEEENEM